MTKQISQREARRLRKRVEELELQEDRRRRAWSQEWFGGVNIATAEFNALDRIPVAIRTARMLGHAVVVIGSDGGDLRFMALPLGKS